MNPSTRLQLHPDLHRRRLLLAAAAACSPAVSFAQAPYPSRPVRLLVGYSAGGGVDVISRLFANRLSTVLGQQLVVDNRAGAAGLIAADAAAKAAPDGYTLFAGDTSLLVAPHLQARMPMDPFKAFHWIAGLFDVPLAIVVNNDFPARTPREFIDVLRRSPGKYAYATSGVGTVHHLGFEMMKNQTGTFVLHIPYRGAAQIVPDVISGQVPIGVVSVSAAAAQARGGRLRAIALMSSAKVAGAENIPPLADAVPGFDAVPRIFLLAPVGTPAEALARLSEASRTVMGAADLPGAAAALGAVPWYVPAAPLAQAIARESAMWGKVIAEQKITAQS